MARKNKNKKRVKRTLAVPYPGSLLSVLLVAALISLTYLWMADRCDTLGNEIGALEGRHLSLQNQLSTEKSLWAQRTSLEGIRLGLQRWGVEMSLPSMDRIVMVRRQDVLAHTTPIVTDDDYDYIVHSSHE